MLNRLVSSVGVFDCAIETNHLWCARIFEKVRVKPPRVKANMAENLIGLFTRVCFNFKRVEDRDEKARQKSGEKKFLEDFKSVVGS